MAKDKDWVPTTMVVLLLVLLIGSFTWMKPEPVELPEYPTATQIAALVKVPVQQPVNNQLLQQVLDEVNEDDNWESEAEALATEEWQESDYRDLYRAMKRLRLDIDDEDDITSVTEDESTDFSKMDSNDKDAVVKQYLRVKYDDEEGDHKKAYITVRTEIDNGDVDEQEFYFTRD